MKQTAVQIALMTGLLVIQAKLPGMMGLRPDLLLIYVFVTGLRHDQVYGLRTGALAGLMIDLFSGTLIGPQILAKGVAGYLASRVNRYAASHSVMMAAAMVCLITLVHEAVLTMAYEAFLPGTPSSPRTILFQTASVSVSFLLANALWKIGSIDEQPI
jgi:rod shape-determining protein MreD